MTGNDCGYEWWRNRKHPRVNKAPNLDGVKQEDEGSAAKDRAPSTDVHNYKASGPALSVNADLQGSAIATLDVSSTPPNADIEVDRSFIGNTPSSFGLPAGEHTVKISKNGYRPWERKIMTSTGAVRLVAELEAMPPGYVPAPAAAPRTVEADRTTPVLVNTAVASIPVPAQTVEHAKSQSAGMIVAGDRNVVGQSKPYPSGLTTKEQSSICVADRSNLILCNRFVPAVSLRLSRRQAEGTLGITYLISQLRPSQANRHNQNTPAEQSDVADAKQSEPRLVCQ